MGFNLKQLMRSWYIFFFQLPFIPERIVGTERFFRNTFSSMSMNQQAFTNDDIAAYVKAYEQPGAVKAAINYYRATFRNLRGPHLPKIKAPVLMLWGEHDKALGKELTYRTRDYCEQEPNILYDPQSGHFVQHDNPTWVNEKLLKFFERREAGTMA